MSQVTDRGGVNFYPTWSPDGKQIAFSSDTDGDFEILLMNVDGSAVRQLTNNREVDLYPLWSPDGTQVVFLSRRDGNLEMLSVDVDGSEVTELGYPYLWFDWID